MYQCTHCGRPADPVLGCPYCGQPPPPLAVELERLNRDIAEMSARDLAIQKERAELSAKMQAALHQRALLQAAQSQRLRRSRRPRAATRRITPRLPTQARPGRHPVPPPPPPRQRPAAAPASPAPAGEPDGLRPEASSRSVQNVLLALGALLLGIAALTFTVAVLSELDDMGRAAILVVVSAAVLMVPPIVVRRGLTATAETVTTVGLVLMLLAGQAFWQVDAVRAGLKVPATTYAGGVCLAVAGIAVAYQGATGLGAPRYAALLALQPAVPLLAYEWVSGPTGWALVFTGIATADLLAGWSLGPRPAASNGWLREATWITHGLAVGAALAYATVALMTADTIATVSRAAGVVLLAAGIGLAGALSLRLRPLPDIAGAIMTLAVIGSATRVAMVALPARALVLAAGAVAVTAAAVRALPPAARRGPQIAVSGALAVFGVVVAGAAMRAAAASITAALPAWHADLGRYEERIAAAGWQTSVAAALLTVAAALAVPTAYRWTATVAGATISAVAAPASFGLGWQAAPWLLVAAAVVLAATGIAAPTVPAARAHVVAALAVGLVAAASSLARPSLTAGVLTALTFAGALIGSTRWFVAGGPHADLTTRAAQGAAAATLPGAVATTVAAARPDAGAVPVLAAGFLAVSAALGYAALAQVATRTVNRPVVLGSTLGAFGIAVAAYVADDATVVDHGVATLLLIGALMLWLVPSIDANRRPDRWIDGADVAAAAVTAGAIGALARSTALLVPGTELAATAALVLALAVGVRAMPPHWRAGPVLGCALGGGLVGVIAGFAAASGILRVLTAATPIWATDLASWPAAVAGGPQFGWQTPVSLLLLAAAAAAALPRADALAAVQPLRARAVLVPTCVGLAVAGAPAALALPWWSPTVGGLVVGTLFGLAAVYAPHRATAVARAWVAVALGAYAVGASLVQPWATASTLAGLATAATLVATAARLAITTRSAAPSEGPETVAAATPPAGAAVAPSTRIHLVRIGGAALITALVALPAALACTAASLDRPDTVVLGAALATASLGLAVTALLRRHIADYLPYATVGTAAASTGVALVALPLGEAYGVYAAAAAMLAVHSELVRADAAEHVTAPRPARRWPRWTRSAGSARSRLLSSGVLTPGLLAAAALPTLLALASLGPSLAAVLVEPHRTLLRVWQGPDAAGVDWTARGTAAGVTAALVLTLTAALAAARFGERAATRLTRDEVLAQVVPVLLPGLAVTLLIAPAGLGLGWPAGTTAALAVFAISMLGVALSPPPPQTEAARPVRATRWVTLVIGLAAGGAGLAGSLATRALTVATLAGAVAVGLTAALGGRTRSARILGWGFASASAHALAYVIGAALGMPSHWSAISVMAVAALALAAAAAVPKLRRVTARGEGPALEWSGYAGGLAALVLAARSLPHLTALVAAWGAVLGISAVRPGRSGTQRRTLLWCALGFELAAWWLVMQIADVGLIEAYTVPFAALALLVGLIELRHRPELGSWAAYGPALGAAFVPTLAVVLTTDTTPVRRVLLLLGAVATLIVGSRARQRAPVVVGSVVTAVAALHELVTVSVWLIFIPIGVLLVVLGANYEKRRRDFMRLRGALGRMR